MKSFTFIALLIAFSFGEYKGCEQLEDQSIEIREINDTLLIGMYYIKVKIGNSYSVILSEKANSSCDNPIQINKKYEFRIQRINTAPIIGDVAFRLYKEDIYIDGVLVFPKNTDVYISKSLVGLCVTHSR